MARDFCSFRAIFTCLRCRPLLTSHFIIFAALGALFGALDLLYMPIRLGFWARVRVFFGF